MTDRLVLVLGTLDTKGAEVAYLADGLRRSGASPWVLDLSVFGPPATLADLPRDEVARAAGASVEDLRRLGNRAQALAAMARGARVHAARLLEEGRLAGVLGVGGSQGTVAATRVMAGLPYGLPKLMVSTMASGNTRPYVGTADIAMLFPVVDLLTLNRFSRRALDNAAAAMAGMAGAWRGVPSAVARAVAVTAFGSTTPCVAAVVAGLHDLGLEPVVFHANGAGGEALEEWVERGEFVGVVDVTTTELADELAGGHRSAGPRRMEAAGRRGLPHVVTPGALDMVNFGPVETVPGRHAGRQFHRHNAGTTLMRTTPSENAALGRWMAEKLNRATGPVGVAIPRRGFSAYDVAAGPFFDPEADTAFGEALKSALRAGIPVVEVDAHINDRAFADAVVRLYAELAG
ncbi:MAG: hypothetical protein A3F92_12270 [Candidatus Rokubacteria bacterium RIFCSPLOWO2_12_FULL_71_22]|nr:MAG: hypothetical protein A3F92_12270 [Candidatus Rokubacteria bacterium RIFCSPLOWO2_12_FULL_71_22]